MLISLCISENFWLGKIETYGPYDLALFQLTVQGLASVFLGTLLNVYTSITQYFCIPKRCTETERS